MRVKAGKELDMIHIVRRMIRCIPHFALVAAMLIPFASSATTIKALSFAILGEFNKTGDKGTIKNYILDNDIDFGVFDFAKASNYFINNDFSEGGKTYKVKYCDYAVNKNHYYKYFIYDSAKYELANDPLEEMSANTITAVFRDEYGDQFALINLRGSYSASSVKTYIDGIAAKYHAAKLIVTYNARVGTSNADTLNASLTTDASGPGMTCLGRTAVVDDETETAIGGVYLDPADVPTSYSVSLVPKSIGTTYDGTLAMLEFPTKYKVIFNDWDGTGLQTNIVFAGESVTPPTPEREGYTFTGWDHDASEFAPVSESFTATAQYAENAAWLLVSGDPENYGTADPAYGTAASIAVGDSFIASVTATNLLESGIERYVCTGYTHYEITDVVTGARTVAQEGNAASFAYTHILHDELVWHFTNEWLVTASASVGGSVSAAETWVRNGTAVSLAAIPDEGYSFWCWKGDADGGNAEGISDVTAATISPVVTSARSFYAVFTPIGVADPSVQYVSTAGGNGNNGYSAESPKLTVQAAVDTLVIAPGFGTVYVAGGTYKTTKDPGVCVTNAISIFGVTGRPEDVIFENELVKDNTSRVLLLNHPAAFVANVVLENGRRPQGYSYGANVAIDAAGGTVSNCVLRGGSWSGMYARGVGAWLNSRDALLTHCVVTNNALSGASKQLTGEHGGIFVHVAKGTVSNCLIANNIDNGGMGVVTDDRQAASCSVTIEDGRLLNCTVATNEARYTGGVYLGSKGYATNVVVAGCVNKCTCLDGDGNPKYTDIGFKGTLSHVAYCASDGGEALNATCIAGTATEFFRDMAGRDYRPSLASSAPLVDAGIAYDGIASFDLRGKKRVQGHAPDIGAYESAPSGLAVYIR